MQVNVLEYFESYLKSADPGRVLIVDGSRSFTCRQIEQMAKRCAQAIVARTPGAMELVAVFLPKCAETVFANLGVLYSGNIYTNIDIALPDQRIANIFSNLKPTLVIATRSLSGNLQRLGVENSRILFIEDAISSAVAYEERTLRSRWMNLIDSDPICVINTSGSTGTPKGVTLSHRGTIDFMDWVFATLGLDGSERIGSLSPFYFDIYTLELIAMLARGATLVLVPAEMAAFPARLMQFIASERISFVFWVPSIMVNISNQGLLEAFPLPELRTVFFAGEVFPMKHLNRWRRALPGARFVNLYGPIEIHVDCTFFVLDREFGDDDPLPIGYACRNTGVLILNEQNHPCAAGERGELCIRGTSLGLGYWNDPAKTAAAFVQNPLNTRYPELIYRTGDLAYRDESGLIYFAGRRDFQIKHMGYRIELPEIEHRILAIPGIANACVMYNHEKKEITVFYETADQNITAASIRKELSTLFPKYMLPQKFLAMQELPRNPNGKIDRSGLQTSLKALA
jgi:D-alanine--poly(phosphoribitol) ligase subunit 1